MEHAGRSVLVIAGVVAALVVVAVGVVLLVGSDSPSRFPAGSPEEALQRYLQAVQSGDTQAAYALLSAEAQRLQPADEFAQMLQHQPRPSARVEIVSVEANGNLATIEVRVEYPNDSSLGSPGTSTREVRLARESGSWKIADPFVYF